MTYRAREDTNEPRRASANRVAFEAAVPWIREGDPGATLLGEPVPRLAFGARRTGWYQSAAPAWMESWTPPWWALTIPVPWCKPNWWVWP